MDVVNGWHPDCHSISTEMSRGRFCTSLSDGSTCARIPKTAETSSEVLIIASTAWRDVGSFPIFVVRNSGSRAP